MPSSPRNAICLVIDGLHAGYLGPYGNTWLSTPHWDRLASESILFDFAFIDSPDLAKLCRSYWSGVHAACRDPAAGGRWQTLASRLESAGINSILVTDDPAVAEHPLAQDFGELLCVAGRDAATVPPLADTIEETALARFFGRVLGRIEELTEPFLMWVHCGTLGSVWDAPLSWRQALMDEELDDQEKPGTFGALGETAPPGGRLSSDFDPDELLVLRRAYAAQVQVLDACLGAFDQSLSDTGLVNRALVAVAGARGFPLGEHRRLGWTEIDLHEELIHLPWLMRFPDRLGASSRTPALVQPPDLAMTLATWFGMPGEADSESIGRDLAPLARGEVDELRDRVLIVASDQSRALRTPAWLLRRSAPATSAAVQVELFVKPDDRWEVNEVRDRCPAVAAELEERLDELAVRLEFSQAGKLEPLSDAALRGLE